jgi:hypothetical protein
VFLSVVTLILLIREVGLNPLAGHCHEITALLACGMHSTPRRYPKEITFDPSYSQLI